MAKRNNDLVDSVNTILQNNNLNDEDKNIITNLLNAYKENTYKEYVDRHVFYREMVSDMVNDMGFEDKELAYKMANEHCTLQQSFFKMVLLFLKEMAKDGKYFDDRNKRAVELSKMMINAIKDENQYIPFI